MKRSEIQTWLLQLLEEKYELKNPGLDDDLKEVHEFDSIDAIDMLATIEDRLGIRLSQDDKKEAMEIRTARQIVDYFEVLAQRSGNASR